MRRGVGKHEANLLPGEVGQGIGSVNHRPIGGRHDQKLAQHAHGDDVQPAGDLLRDAADRLRIDAEARQVDAARLAVDQQLAAPGFPDVLGAAQSHRQRDVAEGLAGGGLLVKDLVDVVSAEGNHLAEQFPDALPVAAGHKHESFPRE
jgi:hypothetical protein